MFLFALIITGCTCIIRSHVSFFLLFSHWFWASYTVIAPVTSTSLCLIPLSGIWRHAIFLDNSPDSFWTFSSVFNLSKYNQGQSKVKWIVQKPITLTNPCDKHPQKFPLYREKWVCKGIIFLMKTWTVGTDKIGLDLVVEMGINHFEK